MPNETREERACPLCGSGSILARATFIHEPPTCVVSGPLEKPPSKATAQRAEAQPWEGIMWNKDALFGAFSCTLTARLSTSLCSAITALHLMHNCRYSYCRD